MVDHINDGNFEEEVLKAKGVVVVDFLQLGVLHVKC